MICKRSLSPIPDDGAPLPLPTLAWWTNYFMDTAMMLAPAPSCNSNQLTETSTAF
jgi:hypothetical protein